MVKFSDVCDSAWVVWYCVLGLDVSLMRWGHNISFSSEDTDNNAFSIEQRGEISGSEQSVKGEEKKECDRSKMIAKWHLDLRNVRSVWKMHTVSRGWICGM